MKSDDGYCDCVSVFVLVQMSNGAAACLFFGCRKQSMDYLYADEWDRFRADGRVLSSQNDEGGLFVAFSQVRTLPCVLW